jgi:hypothetical protein
MASGIMKAGRLQEYGDENKDRENHYPMNKIIWKI